ncbi:thiamine-phosphate kinase [Rhodococcoides kyotonense]|uniref:thiamine-phosphate kinase n=1 Tax=Rhodococcoides kyotonense TaxID=398843 RepID=UPI001C3D3027|nr:thiamine-phosphate kinase [Rhodococcus kyotonensis]
MDRKGASVIGNGENNHDRTVGDVGEFGVIDRVTRGRIHPDTTVLGPGDDAAIVAAPSGSVVATTDMLVQDRHFRLDWSSPVDIGRKAIAQNGADIAAMGARCTGFLVALGCPSDTPVSVTDGLTDGLWLEAERAGAGIVGGDLVQTASIVISVTALGDLDGRPAVLRSGARVGDVVAVAGRLGWSAAGLAVLDAGIDGHEALVAAHRVPCPDYARGPAAALAGATSLTDVSDGLLADLGHICDASTVAIDVDTSRFVPSDDIASAAHRLGVPVFDWILGGGEDHAFAGTFPADSELPDGWIAIGTVGEGSGVTVDGGTYSGTPGWSSFSA